MGTGYTKPKWSELQKDLKLIAELPMRVKKMDEVRLNELLIHIENSKLSLMDNISHLLDVQQGTNFEYWANNVSQVFTYNQYIQLTNIIKKYLSNVKDYNSKIFINEPSQRFFEFLFLEFIVKDKYPVTALTYVFRQLFDVSESVNHIATNYKIKSTRIEFAEFYNEFIIGNVPNEEINRFKITINLNEPQLKELYRLGSLDKRTEKFNSLLLEFETNRVPVE